MIIYNLKEGIFYAKMVCSDGNQTIEIDARTSDAVAMAVRFNCPIYTFESILSQAGVALDETEIQEHEKSKPTTKSSTEKKKGAASGSPATEFSGLSVEQLQESLTRALEDEAYERASRIRDEMNKRKKLG